MKRPFVWVILGMQGGANCLLSHPFPTRSPTWLKHVKLQIGSRAQLVGNYSLAEIIGTIKHRGWCARKNQGKG
jgi:hypothetical protein